jgi:FkbH-like protein
MRLALLSNVTVEVLAGMLKKEHSVWVPSGFGAWMETALNPPPGLKEFNPEVIFLILDSSHAVFDDAECKLAKAKLEAAFPLATVLVLDLEDLASDVGGFYDERMWKIGSMPWSMKGLRAIKDEINRLVGMMKGGRKKVLAIDFDNTLWAGVIGEDGIQGVRPYEAFQRGIKDLLGRGVLLAGLSKNNLEDVESIWNDSRMVLKRDDFVALRVDWKDKAGNLADVAKDLNLGIDSFVFVDDNPAEREEMKAMLPDVAVPEFPENEHDQPRFLRHIARLYFPDMRMTEEDRKKTAQYQEEAERRKFAENLSVEDYLKGLEIWANIHQIREQEIPRVAQLSQKTNQFNVLTNRYSMDEVARFANDGNRLLLTVHAGDRFGDQGLVAFVQAVIDGETATITDWVMSCRTMNRRLEFAVEEEFERRLKERGVTKVFASWRKTLKNVPVSGLFEAFGFTVLSDGEADKRYILQLPREAALVHQVEIKGE